MAYLVYFPEVFIKLQEEIFNHPVLMKNLQKHHDTDAELQFSKCVLEVATYVGVAIEGTVDEADLIKICDSLLEKLKRKPRTSADSPIILLH